MRIGIDLDNTLNDQVAAASKIYEQETGNCIYDFITKYGFDECLPEDTARRMHSIVNDPVIYRHVTAIDGAQNAVNKLIDNGHVVYIATAGSPFTFSAKGDWINTNFPRINRDNIIHINHKGLLNLDVLIDDCAQNLIDGKIYSRIIFDAPWNRDIHDDVFGIHRMTHWNEIHKIIKQIQTEMDRCEFC